MNDLSHNPRAGRPAGEALEPGASESPAAPLTALAGALSGSPNESRFPLSEYRGARTAARFSGPAAELSALLTGAGVYDLGWRAFLRVSGKDRVRWLNNMVTNSVTALEENAGCYAFALNAQGRIQGDLDIYRPRLDPDALWLRIDRAQIEPLTEFLRRYIIMDKVALEPHEEWTALGIGGSRSAEMLAALGLPGAELPAIHLEEASWQDHPVIVAAVHGPLTPRYEIWTESRPAIALWKALLDAGAAACGADAAEQFRILEGTPAYGIDIAERDLPQETNQMRALNFNKGCYLGQEIVERIRSRGNVHRTVAGLLLEGDPPPPRTPVLAGDKTAGDLTSAARAVIPGVGERTVALTRIRREALDSNAALTADGKTALPCPLPFAFALQAARL